MRNQIVKLVKRNRLAFSHLPLPPMEEMAVRAQFPAALATLLDQDVFEFAWEDSGITIDANQLTHYPHFPQDEVIDATVYPVPHEKIVIQTLVPRANCDAPDTLLWYVERQPHGHIAIPFVFRDDTLSYFVTTLVFDRRHRAADGAAILGCRFPTAHARLYDEAEFYDHHRMLLRFLRILCLPQAVIEAFEPNDRLNCARIRRGRVPQPPRRVVRIAAEAIRHIEPRMPHVAGPPRPPVAAHHRRSHIRRPPCGRLVPVRSCVVNGNGDGDPPLPQQFHVDAPQH